MNFFKRFFLKKKTKKEGNDKIRMFFYWKIFLGSFFVAIVVVGVFAVWLFLQIDKGTFGIGDIGSGADIKTTFSFDEERFNKSVGMFTTRAEEHSDFLKTPPEIPNVR